MFKDEIVVADAEPRVYPMTYIAVSPEPFVSTMEALYRHYFALSQQTPRQPVWDIPIGYQNGALDCIV